MTTFQAVVFGIIYGFAEFLPVSARAHLDFVPYVLNWPVPEGPFAGALSLGGVLALLIYFRHDWASMISSFLQVILFRKRPMTLDERMPFFLFLATIPSAIAWHYLHGTELIRQLSSPLWLAASLLVFAFVFWFADSFSRKTKGMFDWNILDALAVGLAQILLLIPGCGRMTAVLCGGLLRNYNREAIAKFAFFSAVPLLIGSTIQNFRGLDLHAPAPMPQVSWFTLAITMGVTLLCGLLSIGGLMKQIQRKGFGGYIFYRCVAAVGLAVVFWLRTRA